MEHILMFSKTILVTGGCGFIGSHLVEKLVEQGHKVHILDNLSTGKVDNLSAVTQKQIKFFLGDVTDLAMLHDAMLDCDVVFHEAAIASVQKSTQDPVGTSKINYGGTLNILESARQLGVKRVVFASSAAVYGDEPTLPKVETMATIPITPYGVDKLASELIGHIYGHANTPEFVCLRYFNVFGLRQDPTSPYSGVISILCHCFRNGEVPLIFGDGLQSRDFVHVSDVINANLIAMNHPHANNKTLNVGRGKATTLLHIVKVLNQITGQKIQPIHKPAREGDILHSVADFHAIHALGWKPNVNIKAGLTALIEHP